MTVSIRNRKHRKALIWLDGRLVNDCFYADARRGVVRRYVRDADGKLKLKPLSSRFGIRTRVETEEVRGHVRIKVPR